ncbi:MAG: AMP-binding protein [Acidobacteriota bacterium]
MREASAGDRWWTVERPLPTLDAGLWRETARRLSTRAAAREAGETVALIAGEEIWTWSRLASAVEARRRALDERPLIAVARPDPSTVVTFLAALEAGHALVPLHARWSEAERAIFLARLGLIGEPLADGEHLPSGSLGPGVLDPAVLDPGALDPEGTLAVVATSGSSAAPKGVVLSRRAMLAAADASAARLGWGQEDRWLLGLPPAHVGGLSIIVRMLVARRTIVLPPLDGTTGVFDPTAWLNEIVRSRVTMLSVVPTMLRRLLDTSEQAPASLRRVLVGGAASSDALLAEARGRGWPVVRTYGATETCAQAATQRPGVDDRLDIDGGCGPLVDELEARLADDGALELRGATLMSGYLPSSVEGDGLLSEGLGERPWLRTGDLARFDAEGRLHILGRADAVIVTGGENVHPVEVERALEALPVIAQACVVGVEDPAWGQAVAAVVVAQGDELASPLELTAVRAALQDRLADFKRPRRLVSVAELPRLPSGKVDRRAVERLLQEAR